jgi:hypothetical protein
MFNLSIYASTALVDLWPLFQFLNLYTVGRTPWTEDQLAGSRYLHTEQSKDFYAAGFDALVKRWDKCINVGGRYVEK